MSQEAEETGRDEVLAACHWDKASDDLKTRLWFLYEQKICTDMKFQLKKNEEEIFIDAHKAILIAVSGFFYKHYVANPKDDAVHTVPSQVTETSLRKLIRYAYTDEIILDNLEDVFHVFTSAKAFEVPGLISQCNDYLMNVQITRENFVECLESASRMNCKGKIDQCGKFAGPMMRDIFKSEFLNCSQDAAIKLLCVDDLSPATELEILEGAIAWTKNNVNKETCIDDLQDIMLKFASCVYFPSIPPELFAEILLKYPNVFSSETLLVIFGLMSDPRRLKYLVNPPCRQKPRFKPQPLKPEFSGPNVYFAASKYCIPVERGTVEKEAELLQCKLTVRPKKTVMLWSVLIDCRNKSQEDVKLKYKVKLSENCCELKESEEIITCKFKDNFYTLTFKDPLKLTHTSKLELWVYLEFQEAKVFILPKISEEMSPHTIFGTCGRQHLLYGDVIITELHYTDKLIAV